MTDLGKIHAQKIYLDPSSGRGKGPALAVKPGDRFTAYIMERLESGLYRLRLQGTVLDARSNLKLAPGDRVPVVVSQVSPGIILTPVTDDQTNIAARAALVREALLANGKLGPIYDAVQRSLLSLSGEAASAVGKGEIPRLIEFLKRFVLHHGEKPRAIRNALNDGGLFFESKVKSLLLSGSPVQTGLQRLLGEDLKGNMMGLALRLQELSETLPPGAVKEELVRLGEAVADYTRSMNAKEVMNHLLALNGRPFHFEVPLAFGDQTRTLDLYYQQLQRQPGKGAGKGKGGYRLILLLEVPTMGRISADLLLRSKDIDCWFMTEGKAFADLIAANLPRLSAILQEAGFNVGTLRSDWGSREIVCRAAVAEEEFVDALRLIDLKV
ncbi:MAG: flagellar hook-length control protein FliK [bacterium]|nr:flagellar hook-length control protein FliK [bacterium]